MSKLPFEGLRLIELTTGAAGPTVGKVLAVEAARLLRR